jgi:hypothetical protein
MQIGYELTPSASLELNWLSIIPAIRHSSVCKKVEIISDVSKRINVVLNDASEDMLGYTDMNMGYAGSSVANHFIA